MDTDLTTTTEPTAPELEDVTLVALSPADMAPAQAALAEWCTRKIAALEQEQADLEENRETLRRANLPQKGLVPLIGMIGRRIAYYRKIQAAVTAGYLLVPNFPVDVFAVRVKRGKQAVLDSDYKWDRTHRIANPQVLPAGEGRYVDHQLQGLHDSWQTTGKDGKPETQHRYYSGDYREVDIPFRAVKPAVLSKTAHALALKVFDEIGTVQNGVGADPIVVGRLRDPRGNGRLTTFFVAWWLDTATL